MIVNFKADDNGQGVYTIRWPNTQLEFYLVQRDSGFHSSKEAVYILMDKFRRCFYIGETGASRNGGVFNRFQTHKWEKKFWDCALVICDSHEDFKQDDIRKWFEWKLNHLAKTANTAVVLSSAGAQDEPYGVEERLEAILSVCRFLGISWAFQGETQDGGETAARRRTRTRNSRTAARATEVWENPTALAKALVAKFAPGNTHGGTRQLLTKGRKCKNGEWRERLESVGLEFDADGYVVDWRAARCPL